MTTIKMDHNLIFTALREAVKPSVDMVGKNYMKRDANRKYGASIKFVRAQLNARRGDTKREAMDSFQSHGNDYEISGFHGTVMDVISGPVSMPKVITKANF